jgi:type II secretory pathway pseudopilin PulG
MIETIVTLAFLGIAASGILVIFGGSTGDALKADQTVVATQLAREVMEKIFADRATQGYATVLSNGANSYCSGSFGGNYSIYSCAATFQEVAAPLGPDADNNDDFATPSAGSGYLRVTVTVSWNSGNDSISLVTLVANWT